MESSVLRCVRESGMTIAARVTCRQSVISNLSNYLFSARKRPATPNADTT
jgi:hypothetical protein